MFALFRSLTERVKALFVATAALDFEADFVARQAERKAELLRRATEYEEEGLHVVARELRCQAEALSIQRPLASVLPSVEHLQADGQMLSLPFEPSVRVGLHIYVPLAAKYEFTQAKIFGEIIARLVHQQLPGVTSLNPARSQRPGLVYLDRSRNSRGQGIAAPYSARPWPGATVSAPLKWAEVKRGLDPARFTIKSMPLRVDKAGDLWKPVLGPGIDLARCLERLEVEALRRTKPR